MIVQKIRFRMDYNGRGEMVLNEWPDFTPGGFQHIGSKRGRTRKGGWADRADQDADYGACAALRLPGAMLDGV